MSTTIAEAVPQVVEKKQKPYKFPKYYKTKHRTLSKRGVMWLGQTCNLRCFFCYFIDRIADAHHPEHNFMPLEKAKHMCNMMRYVYGNDCIDIQGGEPTIYPGIFELITHCRKIGLMPTLITNGQILDKPGVLEKFVEAGICDFKCSLHGVGEAHDEVVCKKGAYKKLYAGMARMQELGIPFRINCTMMKQVVPYLQDVTKHAIELGAINVSFIMFNPFGDQIPGKRHVDLVPDFKELMAELTPAMDALDGAGIECNVRYVPLCLAEERHRKNFYNYQQFSYDTNDWDYGSWIWTMAGAQTQAKAKPMYPHPLSKFGVEIYHGKRGDLWGATETNPRSLWFLYGRQWVKYYYKLLTKGRKALYREEAQRRAKEDCHYEYAECCQKCNLKGICDGIHRDSLAAYGTAEFRPLTTGKPITDPTYYISGQDKWLEIYQ